MSIGLLALLDDVAALAKVAATSLDDIAAQTVRSGAKAAGVVIDDTAVAPNFVQGFAASRELPIVARIALGSLRNKLLILLPVALLLSLYAPWAITPLLMLGGAYLCYEGAEKVAHALRPTHHQSGEAPPMSEDARIRGAIQTDFILSAEIMAITLGTVSTAGTWVQAIVLGVVGAAITVLVYAAVALIVKADDAGLWLARHGNRPLRALGRALVTGVPILLRGLAVLGTAAMLWVGGGILLHGLATLGLPAPANAIEHLAAQTGPAAWPLTATIDGLLGLMIGALPVLLRKAWRR